MAHVPAAVRRTQLIEAASRVIARDGVAAATTRAIAKEAGAAQASLHYVFEGKEDLLLSLVRLSMTDVSDMMCEERVPTGCGLSVAVRQYMLAYHDSPRPFVASQFEILLWSMRTDIAKDEARLLYEVLEEQVARELARAAKDSEKSLDMRRLARLAMALCDGIQFSNLCTGGEFVDRAEIERIADNTVEMVKASA